MALSAIRLAGGFVWPAGNVAENAAAWLVFLRGWLADYGLSVEAWLAEARLNKYVNGLHKRLVVKCGSISRREAAGCGYVVALVPSRKPVSITMAVT